MRRMITLFALAIISLLVIPASGQEPQPNFSDLPAGVWTEIDVDTGVCLYGGDYSFFVFPNPTPTNNLVIYFQGGGACWDGLTCGSIGSYATVFDVYSEQINLYTQGIFALGNQANPIQEANIVFVPYCSGDLHMGNSQATFEVPPEAGYSDPEIDVFFNGFNNASAVLEWVYANFQSPSRLLISGCSAGGYGALHQAPYIMEQYSGVPTTIISDAAIGIQGKNWNGFETWNALSTLPDFIPELANMTTQDYSTTAHMEIVVRTYPQTNFAQYSSYLDETQVSFFLSAGGRLL
ncbi:MAG: pectin acetylesterase-family hydrolase [Chloroflexota bacterium]